MILIINNIDPDQLKLLYFQKRLKVEVKKGNQLDECIYADLQ